MSNRTTGPVPAAVTNLLLRAMPAAEREPFMAQLAPINLVLRDVLLRPDSPVERVYFVQTGTISMVAALADGAQIEVGMVGREGMVGLPLLLGSETSGHEALVQIDGVALTMPAAAFRGALAEFPSLLPLLLRYVDSFLAQVTQTAACNGRHPIEQRLARWLLMEHDRAEGDSFVMTQEFLSIMLGVRRPGVTVAMATLQRAGLVKHGRGALQVLDRPGLEAAACECHATVRQRFAWLTDSARDGP